MKQFLLYSFLLVAIFLNAQVSLVKDIFPGIDNGLTSNSTSFVVANGKLYFSANNGATGFELWESDGSSNGTNLLKDIDSGTNSSSPQQMYYWDNTGDIYFSASDVFSSGVNFDLYKSDGTSVGTNILFDYNTNGNSYPAEITAFNGLLFLRARYVPFTTDYGNEICYTNGTTSSSGLFLDVFSGASSSMPSDFTVFNNKLYFVANDGTNGRELWVTDGTATNTQIVLDLNLGSAGSNPTNLTVFGNALYFSATHPSLGTEIFKMTTAQNVTNLKNINAGSASSSPFNLFVFNNELYFAADDGNGVELWKSGGFPSNTNKLKDINPSGESTPQNFVEFNGKLYFNADDGVNGRELWVTDGTANGTVMLNNISTSGSSDPLEFKIYNNKLYFSADDGVNGRELWSATGVAAETAMVADINAAGDSTPINMHVINNALLFTADNGSTGLELFKYVDPSLSVNNVELENSITLFPNPSSNSFSLESKSKLIGISIIDIRGKIVKTFSKHMQTYNIEDLTSGLYFVDIKTENGSISKKFIKQ